MGAKLRKPLNYKNFPKVTNLEFQDILLKSGVKENFCIAVSGGPDSLALLFLSLEYAKSNKLNFSVISINHNLRKSSNDEILWLAVLLKKLKIKHYILKWNGVKPNSNIMETARNKRYELLTRKCKQLKIRYLLTAHHLDDQIENFFMRLVRGSGLKGLSSISRISKKNNIVLVRPLLDYSKKSLIKILAEKKQKYVDDPSNINSMFDRVRFRKIISSLINEGLQKDRLKLLISNLGQVNEAIDYSTKISIRHCLTQNKYGHTQIMKKHFFTLPKELQFRVLSFLIKINSVSGKSSRRISILNLIKKFENDDFKKSTVNNILFINSKSIILVVREISRIQKKDIISKPSFIWDNRYNIEIKCRLKKRLKIGYVGNSAKKTEEFFKYKDIIPYLPGIWLNNKLIMIPQLRSAKDLKISCKPIKFTNFPDFINLNP